MSDIAKTGEHTDAVLTALAGAGLKVFDAGPPTNQDKDWGWPDIPGQSTYRPYVIVYPMAGGVLDGPLGCPDDDASLMWQVVCVAETRQRCEWIADKAAAALVGQDLTVNGRSICRVALDMTGGARRDDTVQPPVYIATPRYRAMSTPA